jgi:hypothetical protein
MEGCLMGEFILTVVVTYLGICACVIALVAATGGKR